MNNPNIKDSNIQRIYSILCETKKENSINYILDLGCRDASEAIQFSTIFPNAKVISVEANPNQIELIKSNIKNYPNIQIFNFGASDKEEELDFNVSSTVNIGNSSFLKITGDYNSHENMTFHAPIKVKTKRLDSFLKELQIPKIDILWMDIQGFEGKAVEGLGDYIKNVKVMYSEVTYKEMYKDQILFDKFDYYMLKNGFYCVYRDYKHGDFWGDSVYLNSKI
jgi:FkbM family methyltransferase